ncbi:MAG: hypothetical protein LBK99_12990, partial [Opitutaceae bacterium]|nr:hypothetical protein [Opitutaceae bacterium]
MVNLLKKKRRRRTLPEGEGEIPARVDEKMASPSKSDGRSRNGCRSERDDHAETARSLEDLAAWACRRRRSAEHGFSMAYSFRENEHQSATARF